MNNRPLDAYRATTLIGLALPLGVTFFAVVAWFVRQQQQPAADPELVPVLIYAWIALTAVTTFASLYFFRSRVEPLISGHVRVHEENPGQLTNSLLICWALVESGALLGVAIYFLAGTTWTAVTGVLLMWGAFLATRPQPEWFDRS